MELEAARLLDVRLRRRVEVEADGVPLLLGEDRWKHVWCVVARGLDVADAARGGAVEALDHERVDRLEPALVVSADRRGDHAERVVRRRAEAELLAVAEEEGAEVHRASVAVGRHVLDVVADAPVHRLVEQLRRHHRHREPLGAALQPCGVGVRVEDAHEAVLAVEGLEALKQPLAVVQHVGQPVDRHGELGRGLTRVPAALGAPVVPDHPSRRRRIEAEGLPLRERRRGRV
mmetsp:Transcript_31935/g.94029  ORF Transcript_31935/g.94029 Transcript_31935/m.94029 type:complete len:232 (-) Transcript_31935:88-783(-)